MPNDDHDFHVELNPDHEDPVIRVANAVIRQLARALSILMVLVIAWTIIDASYTFVVRLIEPPIFLIDGEDLLLVLGAVLAVLIAIEVYTNAALYLTSNIIHVRLVVATGLMAVTRKIITFDHKELDAAHIFAYAALALALGIAYWLSGK